MRYEYVKTLFDSKILELSDSRENEYFMNIFASADYDALLSIIREHGVVEREPRVFDEFDPMLEDTADHGDYMIAWYENVMGGEDIVLFKYEN